jgi:diamine N-acetyltransferase
MSGLDRPLRPAVRIRVGGIPDADLLAELGVRTFRATYTGDLPGPDLDAYVAETFDVAQVTRELSSAEYHYLLAEVTEAAADAGDAGDAAGYALLHDTAAPSVVPGRRPLLLSRLYLESRYQGAGVGAALMTRCFEEAGARGYDAIWLTVWERNERAVGFYDRWGFESVGEIPFELGGTLHRDRLMVRRT